MFGKKKKNPQDEQMSSGERREVDALLAQAQAERELSMDALSGVAGGVLTPDAIAYFDDIMPLLTAGDVTYEACLSKIDNYMPIIQGKYPDVTKDDVIGYLKTFYGIAE